MLVVVHGFGEHCGRYEGLAGWFARRGFAVHAYDQRGHGRSPGDRGHVDRFDLLLDDLEGFMQLAAEQHPGLPSVLLGHSMGGLVTTTFVCERKPAIARFAVSGPALAISRAISPTRVRLARLMSRLCPRFGQEANLPLDGLSRDPMVVRRYVEDPLVHGRMSAALAAGMFDAQLRTARSAGHVEVPMLLLHGEDDPLCPVDGSRSFYAGLPRDAVIGSAIKTYPGLRHEIFNEPEREAVYADLLGWLDAEPGRWRG